MNMKKNLGMVLAGLLTMVPAAAGSCNDIVLDKSEGVSVGTSQANSDFVKAPSLNKPCGIVNFEVLDAKGEVLYHPAVGVSFSTEGSSEGASVSMSESNGYSGVNEQRVLPSFGCSLSVMSLKREGDYVQMSVSGKIIDKSGEITIISADKLRCKFGETVTLGAQAEPKGLYSLRITPYASQKTYENQK